MPLYSPPESREYMELMQRFVEESVAGAKRMERLTIATLGLAAVSAITALVALLIAVL